MKTKIGFLNKFAYSFFDFAAYKEFLVQGLGKSILYIFLVTLIFSTISNIQTINTFNSQITTLQTAFNNNAPNFELKNGLLTVDSSEPIYYKYDGQQIIVDTSGKTTSSALNSYSDGIYIDSTQLVVKQNYKTIQPLNFGYFTELTMTNQDMKDSLYNLKIIFPIILLIVSPIISFLLNLISVFLILGPLSLSIGNLMKVKLHYSKACILSFYAMTLPLLLEYLLDTSGIAFPEFNIIFYIIALIYCSLAINEIKNMDKSNLNYMK